MGVVSCLFVEEFCTFDPRGVVKVCLSLLKEKTAPAFLSSVLSVHGTRHFERCDSSV